MIRWLSFGVLTLVLLLTGCNSGDSDDGPDDPVALLTDAATKIRAADTFRMEITHSGADYWINVFLGDDPNTPIQVAFRRILAQYVADEQLGAEVSILMGGMAFKLDVYAREFEQWFRLEGIPRWVYGSFAPGFNPRTLITEDTGFQVALSALEELEYIGTESLEDGTGVYHLSGVAEGSVVTSLLVGMIEAGPLVEVEVYVDRETGYPARLIIRQPETVTDDQPVPTTWTLDVYDINAEPDLNKPDDA